MWKFIYYSELIYNKVEQKLSDYEKQGLRLVEVKFGYFFKFKKSTPKITKYIFMYNFPKESKMLQYEYELKSKHAANKIKTGPLVSPTIYRITDKKSNLKHINSQNIKYFLHCFCQKIILAIIFVAFGLGGIVASFLQKYIYPVVFIILWIVVVVAIAYMIKCLIGMYMLKRQIKNTVDEKTQGDGLS